MLNNTTLNPYPTISVSRSPNTTMHFCEDCDNLSLSSLLEYIEFVKRSTLSSIILLAFIIILAILGNTLVLVATWKERNLHQPNKYFIACLAVADLLVGLFDAPSRLYMFIILYKSFNSFEFTFELNIPHLSRFLAWMDAISLTASIYTLTFISFDRYLKISKPLQYKSRMTTPRSLIIIFIIWFISACFATYAATPCSGSVGILLVSESCDREISKRFYTYLSISSFFLPTLIILIMYTLIFVVAHKRRKMLRSGELGQANNDENQRATFRKDLKVIRMLLIVVGAFVFCWGPYFVALLLQYYDAKIFSDSSHLVPRSEILAVFIIIILPSFNSVCNPIIYSCLDQTYKEAFKHLFQRAMCRPSSRRLQLQNALELRPLETEQSNV